MSAFDRIDKRHRPREPIRLDPIKLGDECPSPRCSGAIIKVFEPSGIYLTCSACGWTPPQQPQ